MSTEETIFRITSDIETHHLDPNSSTPLSQNTLSDLQTLLDYPEEFALLDLLYESLSSKSLSPSHLVRSLSSTMDSVPVSISIFASRIYLSLLLSPNAPTFTLFTPLSFYSLMRSIRQSLKNTPPSKPPNPKNPKSNSNSRPEMPDVSFLLPVLDHLLQVLRLVHLARFPDTMKSLVHTMIELPLPSLDHRDYNRLFDRCSSILTELLNPVHGDLGSTAAEILRSISPLIFMGKSMVRTCAVEFVRSRIVSLTRVSMDLKRALVYLPRYLAHTAPEKSDPRISAVESIVEIVSAMELEEQVGFAGYVVKMTRGKARLRLIGVDLVLALMTCLKDPFGTDLNVGVKVSWGMGCLEALIQRCSDATGLIRSRALSNMSQLVGFLSKDNQNRNLLKEILGSDGFGINELLRNRCLDEKAAVRKATLVLVTKLTSMLGGAIDSDVLKMVGLACSDPLVSIRKAAITALSEAFRTFSDERVISEWLHSVPHLISDSESSIQEECENLFLELILERISRAGSSRSTHAESSSSVLSFPEGILYLLEEICTGEVTPWVRKICASLGKKNRLKPKIATALQNIIKISESFWLSGSRPIDKWTAPPGAWFLLSEVSGFLSKSVDWEFIHHHWKLFDKHVVECEFRSPYKEVESKETDSVAWAGDRVFLLQTISNVSVELPPEAAADLAHNLLKRLENFNMHSTEVNAHVKALRTLCKRKALNSEEADTLVTKWVQQLLSKSSPILDKFVAKCNDANKENSFLTPPRTSGRRCNNLSRLLPRSITACHTIGSLVTVCPSVDLTAIVPILHTIITSENSTPKFKRFLVPSAVSIKQTAPSLYIQAWLTMGKVCLADGKLAKKYIPLFLQELEKSNQAALRNNIVVMMADFCVRYTALVDCYISRITRCLRDPCEIVRRQTFILLSRLLQRDYVKWRGVLFLRFLLSLVDDSEKIRQLADYLFSSILKAKAPLLAYNSFVEAIFVLNDCHIHHGTSDSKSSQTENLNFCIRGNDEKSRSRRMHIYTALLKQMAPEHLLATFAKLCAEILAAASDGVLNIGDLTGQSVLQDAFQILACKEIRLPSTRASGSDLSEMEDEGPTSASGGRAITQAVRKGLVQNTIPIFIELKRLLETKNSPLIGALMECLRNLLKDYKNEIDEILVADKQLQKELLYDMQKFEAAKTKSTADAEPVMGTLMRSCGKGRSALKEMNNRVLTSPLSALGMPKLKSSTVGDCSQGGGRTELLKSLQRKCFNFSDVEV